MAVDTSSAPVRFNFVDRNLIRQCVHCGMCLSACPTYRVLESELDSPRGRIYQMRALHDGKIKADDPNFRLHISQCLNCRACETACPSGVQYGQLLEAARAVIPPANPTEGAIREIVLNRIFTSRILLEAVGLGTRLYLKSGLRPIARASGLLGKMPLNLGRLEQLLPPIKDSLVRSWLPEIIRAKGERRHRVALISGCIQEQFFAKTNEATARVLAINGCDVIVPREQGCCGALHVHGGERETARELARRNIAAFEKTGADVYIINAAGCGSTLKEYGELLAEDPQWAERGHRFSSKVRDISEYLGSIEMNTNFGTMRQRITYQDACHLVHGQRITQQPRDLIRSIPGLEFVEMRDSDMCCGSAGIYNITQYDLSMELLDRKIKNLAQTKAEILAVGNPGCWIQIAHGVKKHGLEVEVIHPIDLLDRAYQLAEKKA